MASVMRATLCAVVLAAASVASGATEAPGNVFGPPPPRAIVTAADEQAPIEVSRSRQVITANVLQAGLLLFGYLSGAGYYGPGFVMDNTDRRDARLSGMAGPLPATAAGLQNRLGLQEGETFTEPARLRVQTARWRLDAEPTGNRFELLFEARLARGSGAADAPPLAVCIVKGGAASLDEWAAKDAQRLRDAIADVADECASLMEANLAAHFPQQRRVAARAGDAPGPAAQPGTGSTGNADRVSAEEAGVPSTAPGTPR